MKPSQNPAPRSDPELITEPKPGKRGILLLMAAADGVKQLDANPNSRRRFKYISFAERVKRVDIDVSRRSDRHGFETKLLPSTGERGSFLHDEIIQLSQVDVSSPFRLFCADVEPLCRTLPQVLHHRDVIVGRMLSILEDPDGKLAWPSVLRLVAVLARDIRNDFMDCVKPLIRVLAVRVDPRQPEVAGEAFRSLSFVFKFLGRVLVARADALWPSFRLLLASDKQYVRAFAAYSLGYLLRKMDAGRTVELLCSWIAGESDPSSLQAGSKTGSGRGTSGTQPASGAGSDENASQFSSTLYETPGNPSLSSCRQVRLGLGMVIFEVVRSIRHTLTSKAPKIVAALLSWMRNPASSDGLSPSTASSAATGSAGGKASSPAGDESPLVGTALQAQVILHGLDWIRGYVRGDHLSDFIAMLCNETKQAITAAKATGGKEEDGSLVHNAIVLHAARMLSCLRSSARESGKRSGPEFQKSLAAIVATAISVAKPVRKIGRSFLTATWIRLVTAVAPVIVGVSGATASRDAARRARAAIDVADATNPYLLTEQDESDGPDTDSEDEDDAAVGYSVAMEYDHADSDSELSEDDEETLAIQALSHRLEMSASGSETKESVSLFGASSEASSKPALGNPASSAVSASELGAEVKRMCKRLRYGELFAKALKQLWRFLPSGKETAPVAGDAPSPALTWAMGLSVFNALVPQRSNVPVVATEALIMLKEDYHPTSRGETAVQQALGVNGLLQSYAVDVARCCQAIGSLLKLGVQSRAHSTRRRLFLFSVLAGFESMAEALRSTEQAWTLQLLISCQQDAFSALGGFRTPGLNDLDVADSSTSATARARIFVPNVALVSKNGCLRLGCLPRDLEAFQALHPVGRTWSAVASAWQVAEIVCSSVRLYSDERIASALAFQVRSDADALLRMTTAGTARPAGMELGQEWASNIPAELPLLLFLVAARLHAFASVLQNLQYSGAVSIRSDPRGLKADLVKQCIMALQYGVAVVSEVASQFVFASRCNYCGVFPEGSSAAESSLALESSCFAVLHGSARIALQAKQLRTSLQEAEADAAIEGRVLSRPAKRIIEQINAVLGVEQLEKLATQMGEDLPALLGCPERGTRLCLLHFLSSFEQPLTAVKTRAGGGARKSPEMESESSDDEEVSSEADFDSSSHESQQCIAVSLCVEIEQVPPSIVTERSISNNARHLERLLLSESIPALLYPVVLEYVVSGLYFVRYAPVNEVAAKILTILGKRFQLSCWPAISRLLELTHTCRSTSGRQHPSVEPRLGDETPAMSRAAVRTVAKVLLRHGTLPFAGTDPTLFGLSTGSEEAARRAIHSSSTADKMRGEATVAGVEAAYVAAIGVGDHRLAQDVLLEVIGALRVCPPLVKKHGASVVALLMSHLRGHYYDARTRVDPDAYLIHASSLRTGFTSCSPDLSEDVVGARRAAALQYAVFGRLLSEEWQTLIHSRPPIDKRHATKRLTQYLKAISTIGERIPDALKSHVEALCTRLLIKGESGVADAALGVLVSMKLTHILRCQTLLEALLDPRKFRRTMASADLQVGGDALPLDARRKAIPAVSRIAVGHLLSYKRGASARDRPEARRATVLQFLAKLEPSELLPPFQILFRRYFAAGTFEESYPKAEDDLDEWVVSTKLEVDRDAPSFASINPRVSISGVSGAQVVGSLEIIRDVLRIMGTTVDRYVPFLFAFVLRALSQGTAQGITKSGKRGGVVEVDDSSKRYAVGAISQRAYLCLAELFKQFRWSDLDQYVPALSYCVAGAVQTLPWSCLSAEKSPAILGLVASMGAGPRQRGHLARISGSVSQLIECLSAGLPGSKYRLRDVDSTGGLKPAVIGDVLNVVHELLLPEAQSIGLLVGDAQPDVQVDMAAFLDADASSAVAMDGMDTVTGSALAAEDFVLLPHYFQLLEALRCRWSARQGDNFRDTGESSQDELTGWTGVFPNAAAIRSYRKLASGGLASHLSREFGIVAMVASCCVALRGKEAGKLDGGASLEHLREIAFNGEGRKSALKSTGAADKLFKLMLPYVDLYAHTTPTRYRKRSLTPRSEDDPIGPDDRRVESFGMLRKLAAIASPEVAAEGFRAVLLTLAAGPNEARESSRPSCIRLMRALCEQTMPKDRLNNIGKAFESFSSSKAGSREAVVLHLAEGGGGAGGDETEERELCAVEAVVKSFVEQYPAKRPEALDLAIAAASSSYYLGGENYAERSRAFGVLVLLAKLLGRIDAEEATLPGVSCISPPFALVGEAKGVLHGASVMAYVVLPALRHVTNVSPPAVLREVMHAVASVVDGYFTSVPGSHRPVSVAVRAELPPSFELIDATRNTDTPGEFTVRLDDLLYRVLLQLKHVPVEDYEPDEEGQERDESAAASDSEEQSLGVSYGVPNLLVECCSLSGIDSSIAMERIAVLLANNHHQFAGQQLARVVRHFVVPVAVQLAYRRGSAGAPRGAAKTRQQATSGLFFAIGKCLPWEQYRWLLKLLLRNLISNGSASLERCICAILDAFHFDAVDRTSESDRSTAGSSSSSSTMETGEPGAVSLSIWVSDATARIYAAVSGGPGEPRPSSVLATLEEDVLPVLYKLLANRDGMVKVEVAVACAKLVKLLPPVVLKKWLWGLLTKVALAMKSRIQQARNTAKSAMVRIATTIGCKYLPSIINALRQTLRDGYMVHVLGHVVYDVLVALHDDLRKMTQPGSTDEMQDDDVDEVEQVSPLLTALPNLLEIVIEDVLGKVAMAKDPECGYVPKYPMAESRSCRGFLTFEIIAGCIPFFPHPAVFQLTAPLLASLADGGASDTKTLAAVVRLFSALISGLTANTSVNADGLNQFCFGLLKDNLAVDGVMGRDGAQYTSDIGEVRFADLYDVARRYGQSATLRWRLQRMNSQPLWSASDPYMLIREIYSRARNTTKEASSTLSAPGSLAAVPLGGSSKSRNTVVADVASILMPSSRPDDTFKIAAEPRMTGIGRYIKATEKLTAADRARQPIRGGYGASLDGQSAEVLVWFSMALLMSGTRKGKTSWRPESADEAMNRIGDYVVRALLVLRSDRALSAGLQLVTMILQRAPRLLVSIGKQVQQVLLLHLARVVRPVTGSSGVDAATGARGQVSQQTVKAVTAMLRYLAAAKVSVDELKSIVLVLDADLEVPERQNSTFALLRAVLHRRLVSPEIYDLMDRVAKFMIRSTKVGARAYSAHVFLTFLMHFPLTEERLGDHLRFFLRNLEYDKPGGRLAALDVIAAAIDQLPVAVLDKHAELMFLPLAARIVNDLEQNCRAAAGLAVSRLIARVPARRAEAIGKMVAAWTKSKQASPNRRLGFYLAGIMIDSRPAAYRQAAADKVEKYVVAEVHKALRGPASGGGAASAGGSIVASGAGGEFDAAATADERLQSLVGASSESADQSLKKGSDEGAAVGTVGGRAGTAVQGGGPVSERDRLRSLLLEAMDDDGFIRARPGLQVPADIDMDLVEEVYDIKEQEAARRVAALEAGAGIDAIEDGADDAAAETRVDSESKSATRWAASVAASASKHSPSETDEIALDWQPLYYACLVVEKTARSSMERFVSLFGRLGVPWYSSSGAAGAAAGGGGGKSTAYGSSDGSANGAAKAIEVLAGLLRYPHMWVRYVATRIAGAVLVATDVPAALENLRTANRPVATGRVVSPMLAAILENEVACTLTDALLQQLFWLGTTKQHSDAVLQVVLALSVLHFEQAAADIRSSSSKAARSGDLRVPIDGLVSELACRKSIKLLSKASLPVRSSVIDFFGGLAAATGSGFAAFAPLAAEALAKTMGLGGEPPGPPPTASMLEARGIGGPALDETNAMGQEEQNCGGRDSLIVSLRQQASEMHKTLEAVLPSGQMSQLLEEATARRTEARAEKRSRKSLRGMLDPVAAAHGKRTKQEAGRRKKKRALDEKRDAEGRSRKKARGGSSGAASGAGRYRRSYLGWV